MPKYQKPYVGRHVLGRGKVSSKGWVVIPKEIRDEMGLEPGDEVQFMLVPPGPNMRQDRLLSSLRISRVGDPVRSARGMFKPVPGGPLMTDRLLDERREDREREERKIREHARRRRSQRKSSA